VPLLDKYLYSRQDEELEQALALLLLEKKLTLAAVESCTGGAFAQRITTHPGASAYFLGSGVVYAESAKTALGVDAQILKDYGVYSPECAMALAEAGRKFYQSDYCVACTGVAGPTAPDAIPVAGTIFIACAGPAGTVSKNLQLTPDRGANIDVTVVHMLNLVRLAL
jgi:nicotinamide-nucleotide amidase